MDDTERAAIREAGHAPYDPVVVAALDRVRAELAAMGGVTAATYWLC